jgi:tRNA dimethylallyltransferase
MATGLSRKKPPLIVIVGPTASGKTSLAIDLAEQFSGEIICADSRTAYKGMDVGTAKPTLHDQARVPHWGLDIIEPGDRFTAADFKRYANQKIEEIRDRGHIPFLVGGTGLYVDAVVLDYQFGNDADMELRDRLGKWSVDQLKEYCVKNNVPLPENDQNKRYIIRAIERKSVSVKRNSRPDDSTIVVGITTDKEILLDRIRRRTEQLLNDSVVEEATILGKKYGWETHAMTGNIYGLVHRYLEGQFDLEKLKEKNTTMDWRLAKRQMTWLRRNSFIRWLPLTDAKTYLTRLLAKSI